MSMLNDTMDTVGSAMDSAKSSMGSAADTAKHTMDSAKKGTERAASVAFSDITSGIRAVNDVITQIRRFGVDDALSWVGLARRRPFASFAIFGSGILVGAGAAILLSPMSGPDLRKALLTRFRGVEKDAEKVAAKVKDAVVNAEHKVEDVAGKVKEAVVNAEHKVEDAVIKAKETVVGTAKDVVGGAEQKAGDLANKAKDAVDEGERKADTLADRAKDTIDVAARKADFMSDKAQDAMAGTERRNGSSTQGHQRAAPRNQ